MLQIRLNKGAPSSDGGGTAAKSSLPSETVTVACPDHLVLADLPVAKSLGAITASSGSNLVKSVGRRSRRHLGERVHFCVCCDHPIAIYGRLMPCEHAFCLTCARSDSSCYLCDERIQKIQTIKMMEGIFICAAPHCLKSFLKRSEFEAHIHDSHADLLQVNTDKDSVNDEVPQRASQSSQLPDLRRNPPSLAKQQSQPSDPHQEAVPPSGFNWFHGAHLDQSMVMQNYQVPVIINQTPLFNYPVEGQSSLLGFPPDGFRGWNGGRMGGPPLEPSPEGSSGGFFFPGGEFHPSAKEGSSSAPMGSPIPVQMKPPYAWEGDRRSAS